MCLTSACSDHEKLRVGASSQAVVSAWLSLKYHGDNRKVDAVMRGWLAASRAGKVLTPQPDK
jgi:hypothetical protein